MEIDKAKRMYDLRNREGKKESARNESWSHERGRGRVVAESRSLCLAVTVSSDSWAVTSPKEVIS